MNDPLHGITLKVLLETLIEQYGFEELAARVPIRCFENDPSLNSSLKFLRKTPWARAKVEAIYVQHAQKVERNRKRNKRRAARREIAASHKSQERDSEE
ncbi:MAG: VF530 family DNA-binding protein [Myxococcota bacterium]